MDTDRSLRAGLCGLGVSVRIATAAAARSFRAFHREGDTGGRIRRMRLCWSCRPYTLQIPSRVVTVRLRLPASCCTPTALGALRRAPCLRDLSVAVLGTGSASPTAFPWHNTRTHRGGGHGGGQRPLRTLELRLDGLGRLGPSALGSLLGRLVQGGRGSLVRLRLALGGCARLDADGLARALLCPDRGPTRLEELLVLAHDTPLDDPDRADRLAVSLCACSRRVTVVSHGGTHLADGAC